MPQLPLLKYAVAMPVLPSTTGAINSGHIIINIVRKTRVDDVRDIGMSRPRAMAAVTTRIGLQPL